MEKKIINKQIFYKSYEGNTATVKFSDLPKDLQPNDIIDIIRENSYCSENNSYDAYTSLVVYRPTLETDEQFNERIKQEKTLNEELKRRRYENYLKLKKEFENGK